MEGLQEKQMHNRFIFFLKPILGEKILLENIISLKLMLMLHFILRGFSQCLLRTAFFSAVSLR